MAQQGIFTLPANIRFGVTGFSDSTNAATIQVLVDGEVLATFHGASKNNEVIGSQVLNSGSGNVEIRITISGGHPDVISTQTTLANKLNFALVGADYGGDKDYNDGIAVLNWPIG